MTTKESDWFGACIISGVAGVVLAAFLWATSSRVEQLPIVWGRCWAKSLLLAVAFWAFAFYSRRRRLGLGACCELGILLLVGFLLLGLSHILKDFRVAPTLAALGLEGLPDAMWLAGMLVSAIPVGISKRLIRLSANLQASQSVAK